MTDEWVMLDDERQSRTAPMPENGEEVEGWLVFGNAVYRGNRLPEVQQSVGGIVHHAPAYCGGMAKAWRRKP